MCAMIYVIEWQKRGPPHSHILAICDNSSKPRSTEDYESIVYAEIPNLQTHPQLHTIVTKFMMHDPCGTGNPNLPCMVDGKCSKRFPKEYMLRKHMQGLMGICTTGEEILDYVSTRVECHWTTNMLFPTICTC